MELEGYSRPTYNKLVHSATTRLAVVDVIHKLTFDEFLSVDITHVTLTTPTQGTVSYHKANTSHDQPVYKI